MKGLSLTQPWATLVAVGAKRIETRSWGTAYRGPVAIHASKGFPGWAVDLVHTEPFMSALLPFHAREWHGPPCIAWETLPTGRIVAVADLVDVRAMTQDTWPSLFEAHAQEHEYAFGHYERGRYAWLLNNVRRLPEPVPCRGALGLWGVLADVATTIQKGPSHA